MVLTLNLMLMKTTEDDGLNEAQITSILNEYISELEDNEKEVTEWLVEAVKNKVVETEFTSIVDGLSTDDKISILGLVKKIGTKELLASSIVEIISNSESDELDNVATVLKDTKISVAVIRSSVVSVLGEKSMKDDKDYYYSLLKMVTINGWADIGISNFVIKGIKPLLAGDSVEEMSLAIGMLNEIDIVDDTKAKSVNALLMDIDAESLDEDTQSMLVDLLKKKTKR